jgi:hypothetical protein
VEPADAVSKRKAPVQERSFDTPPFVNHPNREKITRKKSSNIKRPKDHADTMPPSSSKKAKLTQKRSRQQQQQQQPIIIDGTSSVLPK